MLDEQQSSWRKAKGVRPCGPLEVGGALRLSLEAVELIAYGAGIATQPNTNDK
jgi:hypothetical protein